MLVAAKLKCVFFAEITILTIPESPLSSDMVDSVLVELCSEIVLLCVDDVIEGTQV